jgi:thimet oligopeptidase
MISTTLASYQTRCHDDLENAQKGLTALENDKGVKNVHTVLERLNDLYKVLDRGSNEAGLLRSVHPEAKVRELADKCEQEFSKISTNLGLSRPLYEAVAAVDVSREDAITQRYVQHMLRDFRRAGVDKSNEIREQVRKLKDELVEIGQRFSTNIREDVRSIKLDSVGSLDGLPQDYVDSHKPGADGKITITTDYPDYVPFMSYAKNDAKRLELYTVFRQRGYPKNEAVLRQLLEKRYALAQLLGYKDWAEYITEDKMIKTEEAASAFIEKINALAKKRAERDYSELLARKQKDDPNAKEVGDWQKAYYEELVRREKYDFDSQAVREYFSFGKVRQGVLDITSQMFGVTYRKIATPVWHASVEAYEMDDKDGNPIGRFYFDMHPREGKYKHAAAFPIRTGVEGQQLPEAALICNFPGADDPSALMEHSDVETFFHEFGHLVHHLFGGHQRWLGVSGFSTEWDFVEAPSQMLEEWGWDKAVLKRFAVNKAGETIPDHLIAKMQKARDFGKGLWVRHQMFYAALSLNYYNQDPSKIDLAAVAKAMQQEYSPFPYVRDTFFQYSFGHLDGYSAIYYTYMWSLVIAKDLFHVFEEKGLLNPDAASRYRKYILEPGGSKDAALLVKDFLGRDYTFDAFGRWLNKQ